ncbi:MAG TPA: alanine racemase [Phototrophicaceae bacterium]|nr:alanine racemase [Phototrophicaceae bacterium]
MTEAIVVDTPALLVDLDRMERNIGQWQAKANAAGVKLRPHIKTHKVPAFAHKQLEAGAGGITVAKVAEAEVFAADGCTDIFIAYPIIGAEKWRRAAELARTCTITVEVESEVGARGLSAAAVAAGSIIRVRVELDIGLHRCGAAPDKVESLCRLVMSLPGLELDGIMAFRSVFYPAAAGRSNEEIGREEGETIMQVVGDLRAKGIPIRAVSAGSTPTAFSVAGVSGITEVRPGTYIFGDYLMAERGAVRYDDIALSIVCTVISRPAPDRATIDGGSKTFSGDIFYANSGLKGYAKAVDLVNTYVVSLSEEHGVVALGEGVDPQIGDQIAFYPIHVCTTVNLSDQLIGLRNGQIEQVYPIAARGKRT